MKANLKLHTSVTTKKGHPIIIYLSDSYSDKRIRIGFHSSKKDWNEKLSEPKKSHPDYYQLHRKITELKTKLSKINYGVNSIPDALELLDKKRTGDTFFKVCGNGLDKLSTKYSALKSFEKHYPNIKPNEISTKLVREYINEELKTRKSRGVDSYIRSLKSSWNANFKEENPFKVSIKFEDKRNIIATDEDLRTLQTIKLKGKANDYRNYFLLQFYLGGLDFEVLARLKKSDIINGRIEFNRNKGNSNTFCSNKVFDCAKELFYNGEYLINAHKYNYREYSSNYTRRFKKVCEEIGITPLRSKTPRYTLINRAQELLIDERLTAQIVGHKRQTVTSLYVNNFPYVVQDEAHFRIITL